MSDKTAPPETRKRKVGTAIMWGSFFAAAVLFANPNPGVRVWGILLLAVWAWILVGRMFTTVGKGAKETADDVRDWWHEK